MDTIFIMLAGLELQYWQERARGLCKELGYAATDNTSSCAGITSIGTTNSWILTAARVDSNGNCQIALLNWLLVLTYHFLVAYLPFKERNHMEF